MKIFAWFKTQRAFRLRIALLEVENAHLQVQANINREQATRVLKEQRTEIIDLTAQLGRSRIRQNQLHNAADTLAKHTTNSIEANRAKAHWQSIR